MSLIWDEGQTPVTVTTADQVLEVVTEVRTKFAGEAVLIKAAQADNPWQAQLLVGFDGEKGVALYSGPDSGGLMYSRNTTASNAESVIYWHVNADHEFPPNAEVPVDAVVRALTDFLNDDTLTAPESMEWQSFSQS